MKEPKKGAPELSDKPAEQSDEERITLDDNIEVISEELTEEIQELAESAMAEEPTSIDTKSEEDSSLPEAEEATEPADTSEPEVSEQTANDPAEALADDPVIDKAVDEIIAEEGDALLAAEDEARDRKNAPAENKKAESPLKTFVKKLWANPAARWGIVGGAFLLLTTLAAVPTTRYFILNTAQVRASLEIKVIDSGTLQPLKNVTVKAAGVEAKTDSDGLARLEKIRLGKTTLIVEKRAFAPLSRPLTIGWGSNKQGEHKAIAIGAQYTLYVKDFLSGRPIERVEASSGDGNASSDADGKIVLTLDTADQEDSAQLNIKLIGDTYREETLSITVNNREAQEVKLVPARKHAFVTKRSGTYDVYAVDVDGKNEKRVVKGLGLERDDVALVPHPTKDVFAYVATRENTRNASGYLLSTIYIVDINSSDIMKIDQSEQVQVIGWAGDRLVYAKIAAGASGTDPERHRLVSFDNNDYAATKELASANSFNDVLLAEGRVYYAPSNIFNEGEPAVYSVNPDGSGQQKILDKEAYALLRTGFDKVYISAGNDWYGYTLGSPLATSTQAPSVREGRVYAGSPNGAFSLWVDKRDGKGVLLEYERATKQEKTLAERGGIKLPAYWLSDKYVVYRVADGRETADYILNIEGGEPRKITDTTDAAGLSRWYYF